MHSTTPRHPQAKPPTHCAAPAPTPQQRLEAAVARYAPTKAQPSTSRMSDEACAEAFAAAQTRRAARLHLEKWQLPAPTRAELETQLKMARREKHFADQAVARLEAELAALPPT